MKEGILDNSNCERSVAENSLCASEFIIRDTSNCRFWASKTIFVSHS